MPAPSQPAPDWPTYARRLITALAERVPDADPGPPPETERAHSGVFVSLHTGRQLRGCMGILDPSLAIDEAVRQAARSASRHDPRFQPVTPAELRRIHVEVSILSAPTPMGSLDDLELGRHGIIVERGRQRGLYLPQVATDHNLSKEQFLTHCCAEKAGLPPDAWRDPGTTVLLFTTERYREPA
jgi:AmmeMemoRadiSam system protein A